MDTLISAIAGDLTSRFISFLAQKYVEKQQQATTAEEDLERLQRLLRRIHAIVEEAEERQITNQAMILQLRGLMEGMYLGHHVCDAFKLLPIAEEDGFLQVEDHKASPSKRLRFNTSTSRSLSLSAFGSDSTARLKDAVASLEIKIFDAKEFVMLLASYTRLPRQPYSTYLYMDKCMFGRAVEKERVISFLLHDDDNLAILPIVGPHRIGKKTLVHHACKDERVCRRFPHIVVFHGDGLRNRSLAPSRKYLCIVEFTSSGVDKDAWETFQSSLQKTAGHGSKVIILARTYDEIAKWGTSPPIMLKNLSQEEYWYYFKTLAFGSMDPDEHPKLASLAMQLVSTLNRSFLAANLVGDILRSNPNAQSWFMMLLSIRDLVQKHMCSSGEHPEDLLEKNCPVDSSKMSFVGAPGHECLVYNLREAGSLQIDLPKLTSRELLTGTNIPAEEKFDVLVWRSRIPPYCDYIMTYERVKPQPIVGKKNRLPPRKYDERC